jgi:hypothetical protein
MHKPRAVLGKARKEPGMRCSPKFILMLAALVVLSTQAQAQVFYEFPGAPVTKEHEPVLGPYIAIGDDLVRLGAYGRFNVTRLTDLGLELVFDNQNDDWRIGAGGDVKYAIVPTSVTLPFDLSLNAGFGFESGGDVTTILVPIGGVISRPLELASGRVLTPYGGVYVLIIHTSVDGPPGFDASDTDADVELRTGISVQMKDQADVFAALHLGSGTRFYIGLNWHL